MALTTAIPTPSTPVSVLWVQTSHSPVLHISAECPGLERTQPENIIAEAPEPIAEAVARRSSYSNDYRPCRACALETFTVAYLGPRRVKRGNVLVSFTSQPPRRIDEQRYVKAVVSDTGIERLQRVAATTGFSVGTSALGPVLFGYASSTAHDFVDANYRSVVLPAAELPRPEAVAVFWTLLGDAPGDPDRHHIKECWGTALAVTSTSTPSGQ